MEQSNVQGYVRPFKTNSKYIPLQNNVIVKQVITFPAMLLSRVSNYDDLRKISKEGLTKVENIIDGYGIFTHSVELEDKVYGEFHQATLINEDEVNDMINETRKAYNIGNKVVSPSDLKAEKDIVIHSLMYIAEYNIKIVLK